MKILVTVGTTPFDSLVKLADKLSNRSFNLTMQTSNNYISKNHQCFSYADDISKYYQESDIVLTHAGAGTIYKLLEMKKKIIVFPNTERLDLHQFDIARYVYINNYGLLGNLDKSLELQIIKAKNSDYSTYDKVDFHTPISFEEFVKNE